MRRLLSGLAIDIRQKLGRFVHCCTETESWRRIWLLYLALKSMVWTVLSTSRLERADMVIDALGCITDLLYQSHFVVLEHISEARYGHFWHRTSCPKHESTKISWRLGLIWFVRAHRSLYSVQVTCKKKMFVSSRKFGTCCKC